MIERIIGLPGESMRTTQIANKLNQVIDAVNELKARGQIATPLSETPPEEKEISFKYGIMLGKDKAYAIEGDLDQARQDIIADYKKRLVEKLNTDPSTSSTFVAPISIVIDIIEKTS